MRLRVYNIKSKIFLKLSRHFVKQSAPAPRKTLTLKQNKQTTKQTNNSPVSFAYKTDKTRGVDSHIRVIKRKKQVLFLSKITTIKANVRYQVIHLPCDAFYRLNEHRSIKIANGGSKEGTCTVISSTEVDLLLPTIKWTLLLLFGYRSLEDAVPR